MSITGVRAFTSIFILIGAAVLFFGVRSVLRANASSGWPTTPGTIVSSTVRQSSGKNGGVTYQAEVLFRYTAGGAPRLSHNVAYGNYGSSDPSHAQDIVNKYPPGSQVAVHYSSTDPSEAVVEPGVHSQALFLPGFGLIFLAAGILGFSQAPRLAQRRSVPVSC